MTSVSVYVSGRDVRVVTDAALTSRGKLERLEEKTILLPRLNCVAAWSGNIFFMNQLRSTLYDFEGVAAMRRDLPSIMRRQMKVKPAVWPEMFRFYLVIAGFNDNEQPFAFVVSNIQLNDKQPFEVLDVPHGSMWCCPAPASSAAVEEIMYGWHRMFDDSAIRLLEEQRKLPGAGIGGYATATTVDNRGIHQRLLCEWEDELGVPIDPAVSVFEDDEPTMITTTSARGRDWRLW